MLKNTNRSESGFSLVELLVVVVIIGILAGIAIPLFTSARNKANLGRIVSDGKALVDEMADVANTTGWTGTPTFTLSQSSGTWTAAVDPDGSATAFAATSYTARSSDTTATATSGISTSGAAWCFRLATTAANGSQVAVFNQTGYVAGASLCNTSTGVAS